MARYENAIVREINIPAKRRRESARATKHAPSEETNRTPTTLFDEWFILLDFCFDSKSHRRLDVEARLGTYLQTASSSTRDWLYSLLTVAGTREEHQPTSQPADEQQSRWTSKIPARIELSWVRGWTRCEDEELHYKLIGLECESLSSARCAMCNEIMNQIGHS